MYRETYIGDVLPHIDLVDVRREGIHNVYLCPFCWDEKGHLYINMNTGLWCCFLCGEGGNALTLYAKFKGLSNKEAYAELHSDSFDCTSRKDRPKHQKLPELVPEAPIERRDAVYRVFLSMLPLYRRHALDLKRRGFTKEQVVRNLYRSLPDDRKERDRIVSLLAEKHDLVGVRGFRNKSGKWECFYVPGYLIPFRDAKGRIQALQIRTDKGDPKYLFFGFRDSGIDTSTPVHVVNPDVARKTKSAWITEGPLKADAAATEIDSCIVAPPGISSWRAAVGILDDLGVTEVIQAFDRDQDDKPAVMKCVQSFERTLAGKKRILKAVWPKKWGNGIDDALLTVRKSVEIEASPHSIKIREVREAEIVLKRAAEIK